MASAKLKLKTSQILKYGSHPIIIQVLKDSKKSIATIGINCDLSEWSMKLNLPKNRRLSIICQKKLLEIEELLYQGEEEDWTAKKICDIFQGKDTKDLMFFDYHSKLVFDNKKAGATINMDFTKLAKFKKYLQGNDIAISKIDFKLLSDYKEYLKNDGLKSYARYLSIIRQVYNLSIENDDFVPKKNPFKSSLFSRDIATTTLNRNLNIDQVKGVFALDYEEDFTKPYKQLSLDIWKIMFLMRGINLIDVCLITPGDITGDYFIFTREKLKTRTNNTQKIKIFPEAREILNKYLSEKRKYVLPVVPDDFNGQNARDSKQYSHKASVINSNLRKIGKEIGVTFNLTSMSGRYTYINLAKKNNVPFLYLQESIGHKTNSTLDIYLDVFSQDKMDEYHKGVIDLIMK